MKKLALGLSLLALPVVSSAQQLTGIKNLVGSIGDIIELLVPIVFAIAVLVFFWGIVKYLFGAEHDKEQAKKTMLWGVVALFVMAAVWGLVGFIGDALNIQEGTTAPDVSDLIPNQP